MGKWKQADDQMGKTMESFVREVRGLRHQDIQCCIDMGRGFDCTIMYQDVRPKHQERFALKTTFAFRAPFDVKATSRKAENAKTIVKEIQPISRKDNITQMETNDTTI